MNIDPKAPELKSFLSENKLNNKNVKSSIDQSLIGSTEQKSLDMNLDKDSEKQKKEKEYKSKNKVHEKILKSESVELKEKYIERNPMKLLKIF